jgi:hypothetical protein
MAEDKFEDWCILDLFGHTRIAGKVSEATIAGGAFLRIDIPGKDGAAVMTQFYGPAAVFSMTPVAEDVARAFALSHQPVPATRWDMSRQLPLRTVQDDDHERPDY